MQVASVPLGLVSTQVPLISHGTRSAKLPFFQKASTVVMIVCACTVCRVREELLQGAVSVQAPKEMGRKFVHFAVCFVVAVA